MTYYKVGQIVKYIGPNSPWRDEAVLKIAKRRKHLYSRWARYMLVPLEGNGHQWVHADHIRPLSALEQLGMIGE